MNPENVSPEFLSGFTNADGCFYVNVQNKPLGRIMPMYYLTQQSPAGKGPSSLLQSCQQFFASGHYQNDKRYNCYTLTINSATVLRERVIPHFILHPLQAEKKRDYHIFVKVCALLEKKKKGDQTCWQQVRKLAYSMNRTSQRHQRHWSEKQEFLFKKDSQFGGPLTELPLLHPEFVSGFVQGDGGFSFSFQKDRASPYFALGSHNLSLNSLYALRQFFGCGVVQSCSPSHSRYICTKLADLQERIIPHFQQYPLWDEKGNHFSLFVRGCELLARGGKNQLIPLVDLLYNSNMNGKRRRLSREDYLKRLFS